MNHTLSVSLKDVAWGENSPWTREHGVALLPSLHCPLLPNDLHDIQLAWSWVLPISNPSPKSKINDFPHLIR